MITLQKYKINIFAKDCLTLMLTFGVAMSIFNNNVSLRDTYFLKCV
ncbi:hypothetical protein COPEUT_01420 [Coprococcus eutactus ATCC 27759]|nr:hypothetical protein COPEUT_01420 [Coprococcus eutactus ATCC 27759]